MRCSPAHACLIRRLRKALQHDADEWIRFCQFHRTLLCFTGSNFSTLSLEQLTELSAYADRA